MIAAPPRSLPNRTERRQTQRNGFDFCNGKNVPCSSRWQSRAAIDNNDADDYFRTQIVPEKRAAVCGAADLPRHGRGRHRSRVGERAVAVLRASGVREQEQVGRRRLQAVGRR